LHGFAWQDPAINFLPRDTQAEWIVFPAAVDSRAHWFTGLDATFRREFVLNSQPGTARLSIRAMRRAEVKINGTPVNLFPNTNWKKIWSADVAEQLRTGSERDRGACVLTWRNRASITEFGYRYATARRHQRSKSSSNWYSGKG